MLVPLYKIQDKISITHRITKFNIIFCQIVNIFIYFIVFFEEKQKDAIRYTSKKLIKHLIFSFVYDKILLYDKTKPVIMGVSPVQGSPVNHVRRGTEQH